MLPGSQQTPPQGPWEGVRRQAGGPRGGLIPGGWTQRRRGRGKDSGAEGGGGHRGRERGREGGEGQMGEEVNPGRPSGRNQEQPGGGGAESTPQWGPGLWGGFREVRPFPRPPPPPPPQQGRRCVFLRLGPSSAWVPVAVQRPGSGSQVSAVATAPPCLVGDHEALVPTDSVQTSLGSGGAGEGERGPCQLLKGG